MVQIRITLTGQRTKKEKADLAVAVSNATVKALKIDPEHVRVLIEEQPKENWFVAGKIHK